MVAWIDGDGEIWTYGEQGAFSLGTAKPGSSAVSVLGKSPCDGSAEGSGCAVFFNAPGEGRPKVAATIGGITPLSGEFISLADTTEPGLLAGQLSYTDDSSCHEVVDETQRRMFKTCEHALFQFSPGGEFISASPTSYLDGFGTAGLTIVDERGRDVAYWSSADQPQDAQDFLYSHTWEDENHVLAISSGPQGWHVLRLGTDGSIEVALSAIVTADPYADAPYVLESP